MNLAELKTKISELSSQERLQLAAFIAELDEQDEGTFHRTISQRMKAMDEGKKVTMEELEERHRRLEDEDR